MKDQVRLLPPSYSLERAIYFRLGATKRLVEAGRMFSRASEWYWHYFQMQSIRVGSVTMCLCLSWAGLRQRT